MTAPDEDLLTTEGVDEGSRKSTDEGATSTEELTGVQNPLEKPLGEPPPSSPAGESDPAPPADMESDASRAARDERGPGQQLSAGEG